MVYMFVGYVQIVQEMNTRMILFGDIVATEERFLPSIVGFIVGVATSLLGIGGGELLGPYFLSSLVMIPQVSSGTTAMVDFVAAVSNVSHRLILGDIPETEGWILFAVGLAGGLTGRLGALKITQVFGRPSVLILMLVVLLLLSAVAMVVELVVEEDQWGLSSACTA